MPYGIKIDFGHESIEMLEQSYMLGKECSRWQKNKVYDEDFKKMIVELYESKTTTAANIVREYGIGSATLYKWVGLYGKIQTTDGETTNNKEIKKMKKEINDLKIENEILKKAIAIFTQKQQINLSSQKKTKINTQ